MKSLLALLLLTLALSAVAAPLGILVPAYFYPTPSGPWLSMSNAVTRVPLIAILNPDSGPGLSQDTTYVAAVADLRSAGGRVIGYVYTSYAARDTNAVRTDIDRYYAFYPTDGIFLDEVTNDADTNHLNYYAALHQYIKAKGANQLVVANPGINADEGYLARPTAEVLVTFEVNAGYDTHVPDSWVTNHLARHFCHLPYNVTNASTMTNYINFAVSRNAGWVYITNDKGANPWDTLPTYWTNEVEYIRFLNQTATPTQLKVNSITNQLPTLQLNGAPGTYEVQSSSNFSTWFPLRTVNTSSGLASFTDSTVTNSASRFYRTAQ